jgi:hypothetical protein
MTRVLVAHRKETIAVADRVVVMDPATGLVRAAAVPAATDLAVAASND